MPELIHLERITKNAPKIFAVVNWPEYIVPARGYIGFMSDELIEKIYGGVEGAAQHFLKRTDRKEAKVGEGKLFLLGFVKGRELDEPRRYDRDITYAEFEQSGESKIYVRTDPYEVKDYWVNATSPLGEGVRRSGKCNLLGHMIKIMAQELEQWEKAHRPRNISPAEYFRINYPIIKGIWYTERKKLKL